MAGLKLHPWEPEETVGTLWHHFVTRGSAEPVHPDASVTLEAMRPRIGLMFRALGGNHGTEITPAAETGVMHRRSIWRRIGHAEEQATRPQFDGETLSLPPVVERFDDRTLNERLYLWYAAYAAFDTGLPEPDVDPLRFDIKRLACAHATTLRVLDACPGLRPLWSVLAAHTLATRRDATLPTDEVALEAVIRHLLGAGKPDSGPADRILAAILEGEAAAGLAAAPGYRTFEPVPLWPDRVAAPAPAASSRSRDDAGSGSTAAGTGQRKRAARHQSDQANRRDSLILHRFETILSWTDFLNLNRRIEDDDEANARKAAEDATEMAMTDIDQRPATKLTFDLDMAPHDVDRQALSGECMYPEWDYRRGVYHRDHVRVLASDAEMADPDSVRPRDREARRRLNQVRRQFEALRPRRMHVPRQVDGDEIDLDALVLSEVDFRTSGHGSDRIYMRSADQERDLSVATLIDTSRSTETAVGDRDVISIARESLLALGHGLAATGDSHAIYAFSSLRRDRVFVNRVKAFDETMGHGVEARIAALRPGFYTRLGAAIRHVSAELSKRASMRRLLLVVTDGKPNDLDHYEGRYGVEDTRRAVMEARRAGHAVFAIAIDRKAMSYIRHIFGQNGYAIVSHPEKLAASLPLIYRHLVT